MTTRRGFLTGLASFVAAPAIVRAASLMAVKPITLGGVELVFESTARGFNVFVAAGWGPFQKYTLADEMIALLHRDPVRWFDHQAAELCADV